MVCSAAAHARLVVCMTRKLKLRIKTSSDYDTGTITASLVLNDIHTIFEAETTYAPDDFMPLALENHLADKLEEVFIRGLKKLMVDAEVAG